MPLTLEMLLPLLAGVSPGRCKHGYHSGCINPVWQVFFRGNTWKPVPGLITQDELVAVEYAIREEIAEKGWPWKLIATGDTITAVVNPEPERPLQVAAGPNGAIAITAAYLKACGVQVGGGSEV